MPLPNQDYWSNYNILAWLTTCHTNGSHLLTWRILDAGRQVSLLFWRTAVFGTVLGRTAESRSAWLSHICGPFHSTALSDKMGTPSPPDWTVRWSCRRIPPTALSTNLSFSLSWQHFALPVVRYEYHWCDGVNYKKPTALPAPQYITLLMDWVESQINNENLFPVKVGEWNSYVGQSTLHPTVLQRGCHKTSCSVAGFKVKKKKKKKKSLKSKILRFGGKSSRDIFFLCRCAISKELHFISEKDPDTSSQSLCPCVHSPLWQTCRTRSRKYLGRFCKQRKDTSFSTGQNFLLFAAVRIIIFFPAWQLTFAVNKTDGADVPFFSFHRNHT